MRSRVPLFTLALVVISFALPHFAQAAIPFFGPIIPAGSNVCPAGWGMLMTVVNNIIEFLLTLAIVFIAPIMIAYAGFLYVVNPLSPSNVTKAREMLTNTILGIVIALIGWLVIDAVMAVLYDPSVNAGKTWSSLITSSGDFCLKQAGALPGVGFNQAPVTGVSAGGQPIGVAKGLCADGNTACSVGAILQGAQALRMNLTDAQAAAMSCIAMTESSGNPNTPNSSTGACGTFQITNKTSASNWQNSAFHRSPCSTSSSCNDAQCNLQTALIMFSKQGYQPWTGKNPDGSYWNANAVACVQKYGG